MNNSPSTKALLILALTGALGVGALAYYVKVEPGAAKVPAALARQENSRHENFTRADRAASEQDEPAAKPSRVSTEVYTPEINGNEANLTRSSMTVPHGQDPLKFVAEKCLKEANVEDVRVLSVDLKRGIVVLNFDGSIDGGMGSNQEGSFLKALQVSFGQFPNVRRIELEKENEPLTSLGNIEISGPLNVIRSGNSADHSATPVEP